MQIKCNWHSDAFDHILKSKYCFTGLKQNIFICSIDTSGYIIHPSSQLLKAKTFQDWMEMLKQYKH